jgi:drug/metabolite transporter (DMT)-like permease
MKTVNNTPSAWTFLVAFFMVYVVWGTSYLANKWGVDLKHGFPPGLFSGIRYCLAGLIFLAASALLGHSLRLSWRDLLSMTVAGLFIMVGGVYVLMRGQQHVDSHVASVLFATCPCWMALLEWLWPQGERLTLWGWIGLILGLAGVFVLFAPLILGGQAASTSMPPRSDPMQEASASNSLPFKNPLFGALLVTVSAPSWALGSFVMRHHRASGSPSTLTGYQMFIGGGITVLLGLCLGEASALQSESITTRSILAFFYMLFMSSLGAYLAYVWLLRHVSAALAGTYAYVNPFVAILAGWLLGDESVTVWLIGGTILILGGIALVRAGSIAPQKRVLEVSLTDS